MTRRAWSAAALALAAVLFWAAISNEVYDLTSPPALSWHVALRKAYSIVAFAAVGFTAERALRPSGRAVLRGAVLVALYSAAIEVAQALHGSREGLVWNGIDVACGALGGAIGTAAGRLTRVRSR